jgi:hypothetical protein
LKEGCYVCHHVTQPRQPLPAAPRVIEWVGKTGKKKLEAGAVPTTTWSYVSELQRDRGREATAGEVTKLFETHGGGFGQGLRWEWQLLGLKEGTR